MPLPTPPDPGSTALAAMAGITFLAFAVKAATGFGPALVMVSLGSLLIGPGPAVVLAAFLDLASGAGLAWIDRKRIRREPWPARAAIVAAGAILGSLLLGVIPTATLARVVALAVVAFGAWMLAASRRRPSRVPAEAGGAAGAVSAETAPPAGRRGVEHAVVAAAGVSGGLVGIGGPPLIIYYGARLPKERFRAMIVPILLVAALFRGATYALSGQVSGETLLYLAAALPGLPLGLALGDRLFHRFSERAFRRVVGLLVLAAGLRLLL